MESYIVMLLVTVEQEEAIQSLFEEKQWTFCKTGFRPSLPEELKLLQNLQGSSLQEPQHDLLTSPFLGPHARNLNHCTSVESRTGNTVISASSSMTGIHPAVKLSSSSFLPSITNIDKSKMDLFKEVIRNVHKYRYKLSLVPDEVLEICKLCRDILNVFGDSEVKKGTMASMEDQPEIVEQDESQNVDEVELTACKNASHVDEDWTGTSEANTNDSQSGPDKLYPENSNASNNCFKERNFQQGQKSLKHDQLISVTEPRFVSFKHGSQSVNHSDKNQSAKFNEQNQGYKKPAHKWAVNRNMKMHYYHRKCESIPTDLTSDNFSPSYCGYFCPDCNYIFISKQKLLLHKQLKRGECSPHCIYCDKDNQKNIFQCDKCPKCFSSQILLDNHIKRHSRRFKCKLCDNTAFYTAQDLKFHQSKIHRHESQMEYLCDLCGAKFRDKTVLNGHRKYVHTNVKPEQCPTCGQNFKTKSQLRNHQVVHKNVSEINLSCEICGKRFLRAATLKDHVRRHNKDYNDYCKVCGKGFYRKHDLEEHMRVHTGEKPFQCNICDYKTALSCNLVKHMKTHDKHNVKT